MPRRRHPDDSPLPDPRQMQLNLEQPKPSDPELDTSDDPIPLGDDVGDFDDLDDDDEDDEDDDDDDIDFDDDVDDEDDDA